MKSLKMLLVGFLLSSVSVYADDLEPGGGGTGEIPAISCYVSKKNDLVNSYKFTIDYCEYANGKLVSDFILSQVKMGKIAYQKIE